jgi:two-component system sensor histidine kinase DesK
MISVLTLAVLFTSPLQWPFVLFLAIPAVMVWIIGMAVHEDAALASRADSLRAENTRIEYLATVTERERISRDLHDLAGQALTGLILRSQLVQRLAVSDPERAVGEAEAIERESRELLSRFRETVAGWQQASLSEELDGARRALSAASVELVEQVESLTLAPSVETVLALALRESVTNVVRHSGASSCQVSLADGDGLIAMRIADDGVGGHGGTGSGLRGMRERVLAAGGHLEITDRAGTAVTITFPMGAQR